MSSSHNFAIRRDGILSDVATMMASTLPDSANAIQNVVLSARRPHQDQGTSAYRNADAAPIKSTTKADVTNFDLSSVLSPYLNVNMGESNAPIQHIIGSIA